MRARRRSEGFHTSELARKKGGRGWIVGVRVEVEVDVEVEVEVEVEVGSVSVSSPTFINDNRDDVNDKPALHVSVPG
ncbi:hypothetical protein E4U53_006576 [Claviceps sorghi]|nr:hypothetical protein E4U53_006576 [Claviceps sorghi]